MTHGSIPTHVIDIECPNGCGATIHVPAVEISSREQAFGKNNVVLKTLEAPTLHAQIVRHITEFCPGVRPGAAPGSKRVAKS